MAGVQAGRAQNDLADLAVSVHMVVAKFHLSIRRKYGLDGID